MPHFSKQQFDEAYQPGTRHHAWNRARMFFFRRLLKPLKHHKILEIGAGNGMLTDSLHKKGFNIYGIEPAEVDPIQSAKPFLYAGLDIEALDEETRKSFSVILLSDVLEHIEEDVSFLKNIKVLFPSLTTIVISVPAEPKLFSNYDTHYGHYRRYTFTTLKNLISESGLNFSYCRYAFHLLYTGMKLQLFFRKTRNTRIKPPSILSRPFHFLLAGVFILEYFFVPRYRKGSSLFCVAEIGIARDQRLRITDNR